MLAIENAKPAVTLMSDYLKALMVNSGIEQSVIDALAQAMKNATHNATVRAYARGMERAMDEYGERGLSLQVCYLVSNLKGWEGDEARLAKKILRKWSSKP